LLSTHRTLDWKRLGNLPINAAIGAFTALVILPAIIFLISIVILAVSHVVEMLTRIASSQSELHDHLATGTVTDHLVSDLSRLTESSPVQIDPDDGVHF